MTTMVRACALSDVAVGTALAVTVEGVEVAVVNTADGVFAIFDECSHQAVPLSDGDVEGCKIECYLHGSRFDLRTGRPDVLPATEPVPVYPVRVDGDDVYVDVTHPIDPDSLDNQEN